MHIRPLIDDIPIKYMKFSTVVIAPILTKLFNCCIEQGVFLDALKTAQLIPIHKKGAKDKCSNYHPISLLSPISKIY